MSAVETGGRGTEPQAAVSGPAVEADAARQDAGREAHVERPEHVAPAQGGQEGRLGQRGGQARTASAATSPDSASDGRPATATTSVAGEHLRAWQPAVGSRPRGAVPEA